MYSVHSPLIQLVQLVLQVSALPSGVRTRLASRVTQLQKRLDLLRRALGVTAGAHFSRLLASLEQQTALQLPASAKSAATAESKGTGASSAASVAGTTSAFDLGSAASAGFTDFAQF